MLYPNSYYNYTTHPATSEPPPMVFPATEEAYRDVAAKSPQYRDLVGFCQHFAPDPHPVHADGFAEVKIPCRNRRTQVSPAMNWCLRCMAGYPVSYERFT